jgi:hypothetical protein
MMSRFYANITLQGPQTLEVVGYLKQRRTAAYVSSGPRAMTVIFHEDLQSQESLAADLSAHFSCPTLVVMAYGEAILLYHLYERGEQTDAYVSSPHADLELDTAAPPGNAGVLCAAFEAGRFERRVASILRKEGKPDQPYALAANRHGELFRALGLPLFAVGAGFASIELGEMPVGNGFEAGELNKTP